MNVGGLPWVGTASGFLYTVLVMAGTLLGAVGVLVWRRWV